MLQNTKGIVLKTVNYSETSVVAKIYTEAFGLQSYMVNGVRSAKKRSRFKPALLQPLTLLDMVVYHKANKNLQRIKEMKLAITFTSIPFNVVKSSLALFVTEVLYKTLKEEIGNKEQFDFLYDAIAFLDKSSNSTANFHLIFLLEWMAYLGIQPLNNFFYTERAIFDLREGSFTHIRPSHPHYTELPLSHHLANAMERSIADCHLFDCNKGYRKELLRILLRYFALHIESFGEVKSLRVLEEILA